MAELFLIGMIVTLVILTIRSGRPVILETPVVIHRVGKYHITLAPQLNRAQTFIEQIAAHLTQQMPAIESSQSVFFSVCDASICPKGEHIYLLAVSARAGVWYFQAIMPQPLLHDRDSHYQTISKFAAAVLQTLPCDALGDSDEAMISDEVSAVAQRLHIPTLILNK